MEVSEVIAQARAKSEAMSRMARVLSRLKGTIYATGTVLRLRDDDLTFHCLTEADATRIADALPAKLSLAYSGYSTVLRGTVTVQEVQYMFEVQTIRKIRLAECVLKRKRKTMSGWLHVVLLFEGLELAKLDYHDPMTRKALMEKLWNLAIQEKNKHTRTRLERFDFVL